MSGFGRQGFWLTGVAALLLFNGAAQAQAQAQPQLQQIADDAALAAARVLGSGGLPAAAAAAAEQSAASFPGIAAQVSTSPVGLAISVRLATDFAKNVAVSTARYLPPDQPALWSWASRQRFAVKPLPVIVGASCLQDCDRSNSSTNVKEN